MDRTIHATPAEQRRIGRVNNSVDVQSRDVFLNSSQRCHWVVSSRVSLRLLSLRLQEGADLTLHFDAMIRQLNVTTAVNCDEARIRQKFRQRFCVPKGYHRVDRPAHDQSWHRDHAQPWTRVVGPQGRA